SCSAPGSSGRTTSSSSTAAARPFASSSPARRCRATPATRSSTASARRSGGAPRAASGPAGPCRGSRSARPSASSPGRTAPRRCPAWSDSGPSSRARAALDILVVMTQKRRLGIMGGTFDPIHHGHLVAASEVAHFYSLDDVVFVPTGLSSHKPDRRITPAVDRYLMAVIATASNPRFSVSRVDIDRPGPTYPVDTLRDMRKIHGPDTEMFFITGADALEKMLTW